MKDIPFCLNLTRFEKYLLSPDEVVLFEWLLTKQYYFNVHSFFHYSSARIEEETRIGRRRQEAIIKKFKGLGFLEIEKLVKSNGNSITNHFRIDFNSLQTDEVLANIVDKESMLFVDYQKYFKKICPF